MTLTDRLKAFFRKKPRFRDPARYFEACRGWGNAINIEFPEAPEGKTATTAKVHGFKAHRPVDGDVYLMQMRSGRESAWVFHDVRHTQDPHDMFFGSITFVGYTDETKMPERLTGGMYL